MKKFIIATCALVAGLALADGIESANIVGYEATALNASQFYMVGVQFAEVGGNGTGIAIKDLVKGEIPYKTQMQVLKADGSGYDYYDYLEEAYDEELDDFVPGWADGQENIALTTLPAGSAFWLTAPSACSVYIAGEVIDTSAPLAAAGGQFSMLANPYPVGINLNALTWTGLNYNDQIQVLKADGKGYDYYDYLEEAYDEELDDFVPGWADGQENYVSTAVVPVGQGFWINPKSNVTATFTSPID